MVVRFCCKALFVCHRCFFGLSTCGDLTIGLQALYDFGVEVMRQRVDQLVECVLDEHAQELQSHAVRLAVGQESS
jgi:hypothetical protein